MQTLRGADRSSVCDSTDAGRSGSVSESAAPSGRHPEATEPGLSWLFAKYGQWPFRKSGRRCLVLGPKSAPQVKREEHTHVYAGTRHPHTCVHAHTCVHTRTCRTHTPHMCVHAHTPLTCCTHASHMCTWTHIHAHMRTPHTFTCTQVDKHVYMHTHACMTTHSVHACSAPHICACTHECTCTCTYTSTHVHTHSCVHTRAHTYVTPSSSFSGPPALPLPPPCRPAVP